MIDRKVSQVQISQLKYENATVFYALNPDEHNVLPEYITATERGEHEWVWVVYFSEKYPYIKPIPEHQPMPRCLSGLINSLESDWF